MLVFLLSPSTSPPADAPLPLLPLGKLLLTLRLLLPLPFPLPLSAPLPLLRVGSALGEGAVFGPEGSFGVSVRVATPRDTLKTLR